MSTARVAIVTGSTRGIGGSIAERFATDGYRVVVNGRDPRTVESVAAALRSRGATVAGIAADMGVPADVERLVAKTLDEFGRVDVLVNNAALSGAAVTRPLANVDRAHWEAVIGANLNGPALCAVAVAKHMIERGEGGAVINISSFAASRSHRQMAAYDAAKGGLEAFTRAAAIDLAPYRIRVNAVGPGAIRVDADAAADPAKTRERARTVPLGRLGEPADIAGTVAFLCSDDASYITGQVLYVDGGMLAQLRPPQVDPQHPASG